MQYQFKLTSDQHKAVFGHLFPGDDLEAVSMVLCGRHEGAEKTILIGREVVNIPHENCDRRPDLIVWPTELLLPLIDRAEGEGLALIKIHSHPSGYPRFSSVDDESDWKLFEAVNNCLDGDRCNGSMVMLPDGSLFGRAIDGQTTFVDMSKISIIGDGLKLLQTSSSSHSEIAAFAERNAQTFGSGTQSQLANMKVGVVGCSGTGSPVVEQLIRLGVGEIVCIDPDIIEEKNLNRILNSRLSDAKTSTLKVDVVQRTVKEIGLATICTSYPRDVYDCREAQYDLMTCDFIFGCVDAARGRHFLNQLSTFYLIPYIDMGVRIDADGMGGIDRIVGVVHYLQPGMSSLLTRGVYTTDQLSAEGLQWEDPEEYQRRLEEKYIHGANETIGSPAVIPLNMHISSAAVMEFLNRVHPYRDDAPEYYARVIFDLSNMETEKSSEDELEVDVRLARHVGLGDCVPLLMMPELSEVKPASTLLLHEVST